MTKRVIAFLFLVAIAITAAFGYYYGNSNLYGIYPDCNCRQPVKPYQFDSQWELDNYREEVDRYIDCVNEYLEGCNNDIQQIIDARDNAERDARRYLNNL